MPENLKEKICDFEMMLAGFVKSSQEVCLTKIYGERLYSYWCNISDEIMELINGKAKTDMSEIS